ncbi:hypothetical protein NA56DRAFT_677295 [Hyaloscypha hepaticicola]|uniref:DNA mismatch repair protein S5 domain-containing protein n=1 Tax=Hyaloscypha hepaticicola TaxID=2082293 RepID=A0A2J6QEZ7_9HELO|nr:hypothetical protein NA56DRAFT_677295 [Hyaloscypha hepaticicola]
MAIVPLPQATVHLLGSAQALTTPMSLVKELVDNALDAKASIIDILISPNTIDKIEVRDNGHGIQQEDLDVLGKRGHTSKLRSFDELRSIGGISLGFRGEALASAVQLGEVTVTTRTEGEPVATLVKLKAPGGVDSRSRTSHPNGTTITVTKFMYKLPVRKQTFLKEAPKTLGKIKELLQAYVLARPSIKFSLKVLKESKALFSYAPRPNDGIKEAVSQLFGKEAAGQCVSISTRFPERANEVEDSADHEMHPQTMEHSTSRQGNDFVVDVFMPRPNADLSKIGYGQYISVDSRPVSHEKNTMRRLVTIFNRYVKDSLTGSSEKVKSPFLRLDITCPAGSYDPNVEPAKNDVIFGNESVVLAAIENLFREVYGEPKIAHSIPPPQTLKEKLDNFELLLARKPSTLPANDLPPRPSRTPVSEQSAPETERSRISIISPMPVNITATEASPFVDSENTAEQEGNPKRNRAFDMSKDLCEEIEGYERPSRQFQQPYNPQILFPDAEAGSKNPLNPWIIAKMTAPIHHGDQLMKTTTLAPSLVSRPVANRVTTPQLSFDSDPDVQSEVMPSRSRPTFQNDDIQSLDITADQNLPYRQNTSPAFDGLRQIKLNTDYGPSRGHNRTQDEHQANPDLEWSMDFEHRKELASRRRRDELRAATLEVDKSDTVEIVRPSPHKNRYNAAIVTLEAGYPRPNTIETIKEPFKTSLSDGDPRAYLMRRQKPLKAQKVKPGEVHKLSRAKSSRLPLENIPENEKTHNLVLKLSSAPDSLRIVTKELMKNDMYAKKGVEFRGLRNGVLETTEVASRVQATVTKWIETEGKENCEVDYIFEKMGALYEL